MQRFGGQILTQNLHTLYVSTLARCFVHNVECHPISSVIPRKQHAGQITVSCFDTWCDGENVVETLRFAHPGLLCCDPWSDSPGWLLIAPATLYQDDGSRGSLTRVQGKCNDMHALRASRLPPCLRALFQRILLCNDLSAFPLCRFLTHCLLFPSNVCTSQSVCVWMPHESYLAIKDRDLWCLQVALLQGLCFFLNKCPTASVPFWPCHPRRENLL